jgi:hypothetical protein
MTPAQKSFWFLIFMALVSFYDMVHYT